MSYDVIYIDKATRNFPYDRVTVVATFKTQEEAESWRKKEDPYGDISTGIRRTPEPSTQRYVEANTGIKYEVTGKEKAASQFENERRSRILTKQRYAQQGAEKLAEGKAISETERKALRRVKGGKAAIAKAEIREKFERGEKLTEVEKDIIDLPDGAISKAEFERKERERIKGIYEEKLRKFAGEEKQIKRAEVMIPVNTVEKNEREKSINYAREFYKEEYGREIKPTEEFKEGFLDFPKTIARGSGKIVYQAGELVLKPALLFVDPTVKAIKTLSKEKPIEPYKESLKKFPEFMKTESIFNRSVLKDTDLQTITIIGALSVAPKPVGAIATSVFIFKIGEEFIKRPTYRKGGQLAFLGVAGLTGIVTRKKAPLTKKSQYKQEAKFLKEQIKTFKTYKYETSQDIFLPKRVIRLEQKGLTLQQTLETTKIERGFPVVEKSGSVLAQRQLQLKPKDYDVYKEFQPSKLDIKKREYGYTDYLGKWVERPLSPLQKDALNVVVRKRVIETQTTLEEYSPLRFEVRRIEQQRLLEYKPMIVERTSVNYFTGMFKSKKAQISIGRQERLSDIWGETSTLKLKKPDVQRRLEISDRFKPTITPRTSKTRTAFYPIKISRQRTRGKLFALGKTKQISKNIFKDAMIPDVSEALIYQQKPIYKTTTLSITLHKSKTKQRLSTISIFQPINTFKPQFKIPKPDYPVYPRIPDYPVYPRILKDEKIFGSRKKLKKTGFGFFVREFKLGKFFIRKGKGGKYGKRI